MNNIVLRTGVNVYRRYFDKLESKLTPSSIKHITQQTYTEYTKSLQVKPMFSRYYMVYAAVDELDPKYVEFLTLLASSKWIHLVLTVKNRDLFEALKYHEVFESFKFLDCYNLPKYIWESYIRYELLHNGCPPEKITKSAVTKIRRRARYKEYVLDSVIPILARSDMKLKTIESYIEPYKGVTIQNIGSKIFDPEKSAAVMDMIHRYHTYPEYIFDKIQDYLEQWINLYPEYYSGRLSEENLLEWVERYGKQFNVLYDYQASAWLHSYQTYSYDFMILALITLNEAAHSKGNAQLLAIYKIYRMVNVNGG